MYIASSRVNERTSTIKTEMSICITTLEVENEHCVPLTSTSILRRISAERDTGLGRASARVIVVIAACMGVRVGLISVVFWRGLLGTISVDLVDCGRGFRPGGMYFPGLDCEPVDSC